MLLKPHDATPLIFLIPRQRHLLVGLNLLGVTQGRLMSLMVCEQRVDTRTLVTWSVLHMLLDQYLIITELTITSKHLGCLKKNAICELLQNILKSKNIEIDMSLQLKFQGKI